MAETSDVPLACAQVARWCARIILLLWAAFWVFFNVGSAIAEHAEYGWQATGGHLLMAAIAVVVFAAAWWFEAIAGAVLIVLAVLSVLAFGDRAHAWRLMLTLSVPALVCGVLLLTSWALRRSWGPVSTAPTSVDPPVP